MFHDTGLSIATVFSKCFIMKIHVDIGARIFGQLAKASRP